MTAYRVVGEITREAVAHIEAATPGEAAALFIKQQCDIELGFICSVVVIKAEEHEDSGIGK